MTCALDNRFVDFKIDEIETNTSITGFDVFLTGDLDFLCKCAGKPNSSGYWCIWCNAPKTAFGEPVQIANAQQWTLALLKQTKTEFDNTKKAATKNKKGVLEEPLFDVEPANYIIPILHVQMGIVNKIIEHLIAWCERDVEKMTDEESMIRTKMIES